MLRRCLAPVAAADVTPWLRGCWYLCDGSVLWRCLSTAAPVDVTPWLRVVGALVSAACRGGALLLLLLLIAHRLVEGVGTSGGGRVSGVGM